MKTHFSLATALLTSLLAWNGTALAHNHGHSQHGGAHAEHGMGTGKGSGMGMHAGQASTPTRGEVRKIDKATGKITLRHERIEHLDMEGMTMVFQVADPALLDRVQVGDKVLFTVQHMRGAYIVQTLEADKP